MRLPRSSYYPRHQPIPGKPRILGVRELCLRDIHQAIQGRVGVQTGVTHITYDSYDLPRRLILELLHEPRADHNLILQRIAVFPVLFGHTLIDYHHATRSVIVPFIERPTSLYWDLEYPEVAWRNWRNGDPQQHHPLRQFRLLLRRR